MANLPPHQSVSIGNTGIITNVGEIPWTNTTGSNIMWDGLVSNATVATTEHLIKGEMLHVQKSFDFSHRLNSNVPDDVYKDNIKKQLIELLVHELWKSKHVEFTMLPDNSRHSNIYRARICTVPDTQVRILRERGLPK